jgi:hypothetical protein
MGVITRADECLDEAREHIRKAIKCLSEIVVDECWGHDEFRPEFSAAIETAFVQLTAVRTHLLPGRTA